MARTLDPIFTSNARSTNRAVLVEIGGATTLRYNTAARNLTFTVDGSPQTFTPRGLQIGQIVTTSSGQSAVQLKFEDHDQTLHALSLTQTWLKRHTRIWLVIFDDDGTIIASVSLLDGYTDGCDSLIEAQQATFIVPVIAGSFHSMLMGPAGRYQATCRYRHFKGLSCGYAGVETECNRSYARCTALGNAKRYGGFRFAPSESVKLGRIIIELKGRTYDDV